jgi:DNA invertase Pin-like site-specific DNA recombinase
MARIAIYARVAIETDPPLEEQLQMLREWAQAKGHDVVAEYTDESLTNLKKNEPRPGLDQLSYFAVRGKADIVAALSLDRLGRSIKHLLALMREFETLGVGVYVHNLALDTTTPAGTLMFSVLASLADFDRAVMSERSRRGVKKARAKGKRIGAPKLSPSLENKVAALLQSGVCPNRVRTMTHVGKSAIYRIKRDLECKPNADEPN